MLFYLLSISLFPGFYVTGAQSSSTLSLTQEEMANLMKDDILKGVGRNEVKCGVIGEIGCSWPLSCKLFYSSTRVSLGEYESSFECRV